MHHIQWTKAAIRDNKTRHWRHMANTIDFCFLQPTRVHNPNGKSIGSAVFAQLTAESPYTLQWAPFCLKITPSHGGFGPI